LLAARGADAEALDVLEPVGSDGEHGEAARRIIASVHLKRLAADFGDETAARHRLEAEPTPRRRYELGCVLAAVGKHEEALRELLQAGEDDFSLAGGPVREAMTEVFAAAGVTSPLANDYRRKLTSLLF
jgi:thioredoxin-like negative regulator of GroEL